MRKSFFALFLLCQFIWCLTVYAHSDDHGGEAGKPKFTKHFDNSFFKITDKGLFSVEILLDGTKFKIDNNDIGIAIHDAHDEDVEGATIQVDLLMREVPAPGQESIVSLSVSERKGGLYTVKNVNLQREGNWELRIRIKERKLEDDIIFVFPDMRNQHLPKGKYAADSITLFAEGGDVPKETLAQIGPTLAKQFTYEPFTPPMKDHIWMDAGDGRIFFLHFDRPVSEKGAKLIFIGEGIKGKFCAEDRPDGGKKMKAVKS